MPNFFERHGDTLITVATVIIAFGTLVAVIDQRFNAQDRRIDDLKDGLSQRFDDLRAGMNQRFDAQDQRFDAQGNRIDRLADEVSELRRLIAGISDRVSRNDGQIQVILEQVRTADEPAP